MHLFGSLSFPVRQNAQFLNLYIVNTTSDVIVPNACATAGPGCSLRGAIVAANASGFDDVINFAIPASDGFCSAGACTINLTQPLPNITANVAIEGPGPGKLTVKPATGAKMHVFSFFAPGTASLSGLTISNGFTSNRGGGIYKSTGVVSVINCVISGNYSPDGGGIYQETGTLNVINSTITANSASFGSGIQSIGILNVVNSTVSGNTGAGGGITVFLGVGNISNSTITNNSAAGIGGGLHKYSEATANVKNSIIALNTGAPGSPDVSGNFNSAGFNFIGKRDGSSGFTAATDLTGTIATPLDPGLDAAGLRHDGGPTGGIAQLRVPSKVPDENDLVHTTHVRERPFGNQSGVTL